MSVENRTNVPPVHKGEQFSRAEQLYDPAAPRETRAAPQASPGPTVTQPVPRPATQPARPGARAPMLTADGRVVMEAPGNARHSGIPPDAREVGGRTGLLMTEAELEAQGNRQVNESNKAQGHAEALQRRAARYQQSWRPGVPVWEVSGDGNLRVTRMPVDPARAEGQGAQRPGSTQGPAREVRPGSGSVVGGRAARPVQLPSAPKAGAGAPKAANPREAVERVRVRARAGTRR